MKFAKVIKAKNVRKGDEVFTSDGWKVVVDTDRVRYDHDVVWLYFDNRDHREDFEPRERVIVTR